MRLYIMYWLRVATVCNFQCYRTRCRYIKRHSFSVGNKNTFCGTVCTVVDILIFKTLSRSRTDLDVNGPHGHTIRYSRLPTGASLHKFEDRSFNNYSFRHFCRRIDVPFSHNARRCRQTDRRWYDANKPSVQYYRLKRVLCCQPCPLVGSTQTYVTP